MLTALRALTAFLSLIALSFVHLLPMTLSAGTAFAAPPQNPKGNQWVTEADPLSISTTPFTTSASADTQTSVTLPAGTRRFRIWNKRLQVGGPDLLWSQTASTYTGSGLGSQAHFIQVPNTAVPYDSGRVEFKLATKIYFSATVPSVAGILEIDTVPAGML